MKTREKKIAYLKKLMTNISAYLMTVPDPKDLEDCKENELERLLEVTNDLIDYMYEKRIDYISD